MAVKISEEFTSLSVADRGTKNAWAAYVRRRWPVHTQAMVEREWDLSAGRASGVVWANITQSTIDHIKHHKRGGPLVSLSVEAIFWGLSLEALLTVVVEKHREEVAHVRAEHEAEERRVVEIADRVRAAFAVPERRTFGGRGSSAGEPAGRVLRADRRSDRVAE